MKTFIFNTSFTCPYTEEFKIQNDLEYRAKIFATCRAGEEAGRRAGIAVEKVAHVWKTQHGTCPGFPLPAPKNGPAAREYPDNPSEAAQSAYHNIPDEHRWARSHEYGFNRLTFAIEVAHEIQQHINELSESISKLREGER